MTIPGLLKQDQIVNAGAETLEYAGTGQSLLFTGEASLCQGSDTSMRGNTIRIDQESGNLVVTGGARFHQAATGDAPAGDGPGLLILVRDPGIGIRCTFRELWAACIPWGVLLLMARLRLGIAADFLSSPA